MAAPIGSQVFGEVLPYLEIKKDNELEEDIKVEVEIPNLVGKTITEAKSELKELGLEIEVQSKEEDTKEEDQNSSDQEVIIEQLPKAGIKVKEGTTIIIYR